MRAFVLGASCKARGPWSLISCLQPLNVSLYQTQALLLDRKGGCCFDDDWARPLFLKEDDNLQCRCLERGRHALDCGEDRFLLSQSVIVVWQSDLRAAVYTSIEASKHCLSLELWLHSCGVRNYTVGLRRRDPVFGLDLATECSEVSLKTHQFAPA